MAGENFWYGLREYLIFAGIFLGIMFLLVIVGVILEEFFPKNKISKALLKIVVWTQKNIAAP